MKTIIIIIIIGIHHKHLCAKLFQSVATDTNHKIQSVTRQEST